MSDSEISASEAPATKKPILQVLIIVLLAALLGMQAYATFFRGGDAAEKKGPNHGKPAAEEHADGEESGHGKEEEGGEHEGAEAEEGEAEGGGEGGHGAAPAVKPTVAVKDLTVKLSDADDDRYVKLSFDLEVKNDQHKTVVAASIPKIRDAAISYLRNKKAAELESDTSYIQLKRDLLNASNQVVPRKLVRQLYISDLLLQ